MGEVFVVGCQLRWKIFFDVVVPNLVSKSVSYTSKNDLTQYVGHFFSESDSHYEFTQAPDDRSMSYTHILVYCVLGMSLYSRCVIYRVTGVPSCYICCGGCRGLCVKSSKIARRVEVAPAAR